MRCPCTPSQALPQETDGNLEHASLLGMCKVQRVLCYVLLFQPSVPGEEATISSLYSRPTWTPFNKGLDHCSLPWSTADRPNPTFSCSPDSPETIFLLKFSWLLSPPPPFCSPPRPPLHVPSVTRRLLRQGVRWLPLQRIPGANWRG